MAEMSNNELAGKMIVAGDGREVGEVDDVYIDVVQWRVTALGVRLRREVLDELHLRRPLLGSQTIRLPVEQVGAVSDTVVLKPPLADVTFFGGTPAGEQPGDPQP